LLGALPDCDSSASASTPPPIYGADDRRVKQVFWCRESWTHVRRGRRAEYCARFRDLVSGSGIVFEDRGERELKGVGERRIYTVAEA